MSMRKMLMVCGAVFAMAPLASQAGEAQALKACVKSFVETHLPGRTVRVRTKYSSMSPLLQATNTYTIALSARGVTSGERIAEARCVANRHGDVLVMDHPPAETYAARADFVVEL